MGRSVPARGLQHGAVHTGISSELGESESFQTSFQSPVVRMNYFLKEMTSSCVVVVHGALLSLCFSLLSRPVFATLLASLLKHSPLIFNSTEQPALTKSMETTCVRHL